MLLHEINFKHGKRLVKVEQASIQTMKSWRDRGCGSEGKWEGQKVNGKKKGDKELHRKSTYDFRYTSHSWCEYVNFCCYFFFFFNVCSHVKIGAQKAELNRSDANRLQVWSLHPTPVRLIRAMKVRLAIRLYMLEYITLRNCGMGGPFSKNLTLVSQE